MAIHASGGVQELLPVSQFQKTEEAAMALSQTIDTTGVHTSLISIRPRLPPIAIARTTALTFHLAWALARDVGSLRGDGLEVGDGLPRLEHFALLGRLRNRAQLGAADRQVVVLEHAGAGDEAGARTRGGGEGAHTRERECEWGTIIPESSQVKSSQVKSS